MARSEVGICIRINRRTGISKPAIPFVIEFIPPVIADASLSLGNTERPEGLYKIGHVCRFHVTKVHTRCLGAAPRRASGYDLPWYGAGGSMTGVRSGQCPKGQMSIVARCHFKRCACIFILLLLPQISIPGPNVCRGTADVRMPGVSSEYRPRRGLIIRKSRTCVLDLGTPGCIRVFEVIENDSPGR